jgi:protein dithiol oxidoreductase (disulfide-forming)
MKRRLFVTRAVSLAAASLFAPGLAIGQAQDAPRPRANQEYFVIAPQPTATGDKIEVIDFFWYGCPYCNELQPALESWRQRMPPDVAIRRIPVVLRNTWAPHARIWYTLDALGEAERLHQQVYRSYHQEGLFMSRPEVMVDWAAKNGIDKDAWSAAYNSPAVAAKVQQAVELSRLYAVPGTPTLVVDGRYVTSSGMVPSVRQVIPVLDELIKIARERRAAAK